MMVRGRSREAAVSLFRSREGAMTRHRKEAPICFTLTRMEKATSAQEKARRGGGSGRITISVSFRDREIAKRGLQHPHLHHEDVQALNSVRRSKTTRKEDHNHRRVL